MQTTQQLQIISIQTIHKLSKIMNTSRNNLSQSRNQLDQTKKQENEEEQYDPIYQELFEYINLQCPCGTKIAGPIQFFQHVKSKHQFQTLQKLIHRKTLKKAVLAYPNIQKEEIQILEIIDHISIQKITHTVARRNSDFFQICAPMQLEQHPQRGTFADMAISFQRGVCREYIQFQLVTFFFMFMRDFIDYDQGIGFWHQQSPRDLLKSSNQIVQYFLRPQIKQRYAPLDEKDIKKMIYVVAKWMFAHQWTNDRIFYNLDKEENMIDGNVEQICEKKEEELSVVDRNQKG